MSGNDVIGRGNNLKDAILREQVRLAINQLPTVQVSSFIVALALSFSVRNIVPRSYIIIWLLMITAMSASRIVFYYRFLKVSEEPFPGEYWRKGYLLLALLSGVIWGLSAYMIFPTENHWLISLFVLVIASLSAATTISHSSIKLAPALWAGPAMTFYAVRCFMEGGEPEYAISFLIILYLFTILRYSMKHNKAITSSISLKFENVKLLEEVQKANDVLRQEIIERKRAEEELHKLSIIDELTGLNNRRGFLLLAKQQIKIADRLKKYAALIYADMDNMKWINDTFGHREGDQALIDIANILKSALRASDVVARYGGDEFVGLVLDSTEKGAEVVCAHIQEKLNAYNLEGNRSFKLSISFGLTRYDPKNPSTLEELLERADRLMYEHKQRKK